MKLDPLIEAEKIAGHSVQRTCGLFEVSRAAYYQRSNGEPSTRARTVRKLESRLMPPARTHESARPVDRAGVFVVDVGGDVGAD